MLRNLYAPLRSELQRRLIQQAPRNLSRRVTTPPAATPNEEQQVSNEPIQYFGSQAAKWRAKDTRSGGADDVLSYQPYVISASLAIFLLYFCWLREESDIDRKLEGSLYDHVSGMEELQLSVAYKYNKEHGLETVELEKRLSDLGIDVKQLDAIQ